MLSVYTESMKYEIWGVVYAKYPEHPEKKRWLAGTDHCSCSWRIFRLWVCAGTEQTQSDRSPDQSGTWKYCRHGFGYRHDLACGQYQRQLEDYGTNHRRKSGRKSACESE